VEKNIAVATTKSALRAARAYQTHDRFMPALVLNITRLRPNGAGFAARFPTWVGIAKRAGTA
jgi:hypothetical protein